MHSVTLMDSSGLEKGQEWCDLKMPYRPPMEVVANDLYQDPTQKKMVKLRNLLEKFIVLSLFTLVIHNSAVITKKIFQTASVKCFVSLL